jgi:DNA-binding CsgD family transcriptional regulator
MPTSLGADRTADHPRNVGTFRRGVPPEHPVGHHGAVPTPLPVRLATASRGAVDLPTLADAVFAAVDAVVPFAFACLATTDPTTGLISAAFKSHPLEIGDEEWAAVEYGYPDVNQFSDLARREKPVGALVLDTGGAPENCRRFREFLAPRFGFTDELRVVCRRRGLTWGAIALHRGPGEPPFTAAEVALVGEIGEQLAELLQRTVFAELPTAARDGGGPSVIVVDRDNRATNLTPAAVRRIEELGGWDHDALPATVLAVAEAARRTPELAVTRVPGRSGSWLVLRATTLAPAGSTDGTAPVSRGDVVVTVEAASPGEVSALALAARGLSSREQDVAGLVLQGAATTAIAGALHLSPHTVQDHLKSIFAKLGVNSRRELIRQLALT